MPQLAGHPPLSTWPFIALLPPLLPLPILAFYLLIRHNLLVPRPGLYLAELFLAQSCSSHKLVPQTSLFLKQTLSSHKLVPHTELSKRRALSLSRPHSLPGRIVPERHIQHSQAVGCEHGLQGVRGGSHGSLHSRHVDLARKLHSDHQRHAVRARLLGRTLACIVRAATVASCGREGM